jgi:predicted Fe-Mo cluster-binding NifX family protein
MKVAFTTSGEDREAPLDSRFGRASRFFVYDLDAETSQVVDNQQSVNAAQGAGIQAAETVVRSGAQAVVTGHCGPKAFRVLSASGIKVFTTDAPTVAEALERFRAGQLTEITSASVEGHWA